MKLEMGFDCPECGEGTQLGPARGPLLARTCGRCGGALLGPGQAARFRTAAVAAPRPLPKPRTVFCPSCGEAISLVVIGETEYGECGSCGVAWVGRGPLLGWVIERIAGKARPERPAPRRRRALPWLLGGVLTIAAAAVAWTIWGDALAAKLRPASPPPKPAAAVASAPAKPAAASPAPEQTKTPEQAKAGDQAKAAETAPPVVSVPPPSIGPIEQLPADAGRPRILLAHRPGRSATLLIRFACGSVDDRLPGLTRVAQHALLVANRRLNYAQLAADLHAAAATLRMTTGVRDATFTLSADARDFPALARTLLPALLDPSFVPGKMPDVLDRARLDAAETPDMLQTLATLAGDDARYINAPVGGAGDVDAITAQHVAHHLQGGLAAANATVVVAGEFEQDALVRLLQAVRGGEPAIRGRVHLRTPFSTRRRSPREFHILAYPLTIETPRQAAAARMLAQLLSDALWRKLRRAGVGYSQEATATRRDWIDVLVLTLAARDPSTDLGPVLRDLVDGVREGRIPDADLARARSSLRAELAAVDSDPEALAWTLATAGPGWHGQEVALELERLDRAGLVDQVRPWLDPSSSVYIYLGNRSTSFGEGGDE